MALGPAPCGRARRRGVPGAGADGRGGLRRTMTGRRAEQRLLGLVAMNDPAKPAARSTIEECRAAGIVPVLITGDHPATARAVALRVGVLTPEEADREGSVVTGPQIAAGEIADLTGPRVFARTSPEQKLDIVQAWKDRGAVVAMTGDGVNDGPALHRADIGVAMGHRGTEVARQAADLVLADDDLATVGRSRPGRTPRLRQHPTLPGLRPLRWRSRDPRHAARPVHRARRPPRSPHRSSGSTCSPTASPESPSAPNPSHPTR